MIGRIFGDRRRLAILRRVDRPAAVLIAILQAIVAAIGWFAIEPVVLAITIAAQLALGGLAAAYVIGPARPDSGLARYAMPAVASTSPPVTVSSRDEPRSPRARGATRRCRDR